MNKTCYKQYDSRWAKMLYPKKPWYITNCGCGEVSICNVIIEMSKYAKNQTPKTIQPYMVQFAASNGDGTYHSGIPKAMKHYGLTEVMEHATMSKLWTELKKGNRVAILLMGSRPAGSKKVHWTGSGHFVAAVGYKEQNGKHFLYIKDSASTSTLRNGWVTYEENIKGACLKVWSGKLPATTTTTTTTTTASKDGKLVVDGIGGEATVNRLQQFLGVSQTGGITIREDLQKYCPSLKAYEYGDGSPTVKAMQKWLGLSNPDGLWGPNTSKALQKKVGVTADGIFGTASMKALQTYLNSNDKAVYPEPKPAMSANAKKIVDKARALAWAKGTAEKKYAYKGGAPTSAFKTALNKQYPKRVSWGDAPKVGAACDVFVGTVVKSAGIGVTDYPRGLNEQIKYTSSKFERLTYRNVTPYSVSKDGDIVMYYKNEKGTSKHTIIRGDGVIYEAQLKLTYGHVNTSVKSKLDVKRPYVVILRAK